MRSRRGQSHQVGNGNEEGPESDEGASQRGVVPCGIQNINGKWNKWAKYLFK